MAAADAAGPPVYLDNAATSFPKAPGVEEAVVRCLRETAGSPGRAAHRGSQAAARIVAEARTSLARLLGVSDPRRIIFTANCTEALNRALKGILRPGDHCVTTDVEHNSVLRPLRALEERGVAVTRLPASPIGAVDPAAVSGALRPETRLVALALASNVTGTIQPWREIAAACRARGVAFLADAAQAAGALPIRMEADGIELLAAPGHKALLGPAGTGILCLGPGVALAPLTEGGTGSLSESDAQPDLLPDRHEAGTPNTPGIAGLGAAAEFLLATTVEAVRERERALMETLTHALVAIPGVRLYGPPPGTERACLASLTAAGWDPQDLAAALESAFNVQARAGLHCAPRAHAALGTLPGGTLRLSPGFFTTAAELEYAAGALADMAATGDG